MTSACHKNTYHIFRFKDCQPDWKQVQGQNQEVYYQIIKMNIPKENLDSLLSFKNNYVNRAMKSGNMRYFL